MQSISKSNKYYIIGSGGHALVIIDAIEASNESVVGLFDVCPSSTSLYGYPIFQLETIEEFLDSRWVIAIGSNKIRKQVAMDFIKYNFGIVIHPKSTVSKRIIIGKGTAVMAGATVNSSCRIGCHCILNTNCSIDHECEINDFVHISPNATLCGNVRVGEGAHIGAGSVIIPGVNIGKWVTIGAGSVIIHDVPDYAVVVGNPGRIIKNNKENEV